MALPFQRVTASGAEEAGHAVASLERDTGHFRVGGHAAAEEARRRVKPNDFLEG
ncbi:hypothetical protein D3C75_1385020 [compost metagenome]